MSRFRSPAARVRTSVAGVVAAAVATGGMATVPAAAAAPAAAPSATTAAARARRPRQRPRRSPRRRTTSSCSAGRPASATGRSVRASVRSSASARSTASPSTPPRTLPSSPPPTSRSTRRSSGCRRPATCSTTTQQAAFEDYVQAGGGYVGVHAASDTEYTWPWYGQLVGAYFQSHPAGTPTATIDVEDKTTPSRARCRTGGSARTSGTTSRARPTRGQRRRA